MSDAFPFDSRPMLPTESKRYSPTYGIRYPVPTKKLKAHERVSVVRD